MRKHDALEEAMLKIKKIYILCPPLITGGPEAMHQFVHKMRGLGHDATIVYVPAVRLFMLRRFKMYNFAYKNGLSSIEDHPDNLLIVPEIWTSKLNLFNHIHKAIWWLSVDYYYWSVKQGVSDEFDFERRESENVIHFACSAYTEHFLLSNKAPNVFRIGDYINQSFHRKKAYTYKRSDNVLFNPKKGKEIAERLMSASSSLKWIPIQNMTEFEVAEILRKSKVYVDFGSFPGADRLYREAALNGCCVIVGLSGAARFYDDMPIKDDYKFSIDPLDVSNIIRTIRDCLNHFDERAKDFSIIREHIRGAEHRLEHQIIQAFGQRKHMGRSHASIQYLKNVSKYLMSSYFLIDVRSKIQNLLSPKKNYA